MSLKASDVADMRNREKMNATITGSTNCDLMSNFMNAGGGRGGGESQLIMSN